MPTVLYDTPLRDGMQGEGVRLSVKDKIRITDYEVRVITRKAAGSVVRALVESSEGVPTWSTVGVSANLVEASFRALVDALEYELQSDGTAAVEPPAFRQ